MTNFVFVRLEASKMPHVSEQLIQYGYTCTKIIKEAGGQVVLLIDNDKKTYSCPSFTVTNYEITWEDFVDLFL
jgi:hypothetical protein|nr:MAG TPA: hypothetical protein [Caudoviricetes sp.]